MGGVKAGVGIGVQNAGWWYPPFEDIAVYGLRGPALAVRPRRAGDLPVLVHVVLSACAGSFRLRRTGQPLASNAAAVLPSSNSEESRHPDLPSF
jgi:hypothetical protein